MDAYKYGAPPHGGMAYGLDRLVMLMLGRDSIRDVIAFPKVQNAGEPMSGAPDVVDEKQLADLSIALTLPEKNDTEGRPRQQACCRGRPFCAGTIICRFFVPFCAPPVGEQFFQGNGLPRLVVGHDLHIPVPGVQLHEKLLAGAAGHAGAAAGGRRVPESDQPPHRSLPALQIHVQSGTRSAHRSITPQQLSMQKPVKMRPSALSSAQTTWRA